MQSCKACTGGNAGKAWRGFATELGTRKYVAAIPGLKAPVGAGHFRKDISMGSYDTPGSCRALLASQSHLIHELVR